MIEVMPISRRGRLLKVEVGDTLALAGCSWNNPQVVGRGLFNTDNRLRASVVRGSSGVCSSVLHRGLTLLVSWVSCSARLSAQTRSATPCRSRDRERALLRQRRAALLYRGDHRTVQSPGVLHRYRSERTSREVTWEPHAILTNPGDGSLWIISLRSFDVVAKLDLDGTPTRLLAIGG